MVCPLIFLYVGFGWQTAATVAEGWGLDAANMDFALVTGVGDGIGVAVGHTTYMAIKKAVTGSADIDMTAQAQTGIFLGSAAVCSGGIWQPFVNTLQAAGLGFNTSLVLTAGCGTLAFFSGLRLGRLIYSPIFAGVEEANYANLKADAALSVAVGGAAGCFVGTDVSYAGANWLRPLVGVEETCASTTASVLAGSSTALGFMSKWVRTLSTPRTSAGSINRFDSKSRWSIFALGILSEDIPKMIGRETVASESAIHVREDDENVPDSPTNLYLHADLNCILICRLITV